MAKIGKRYVIMAELLVLATGDDLILCHTGFSNMLHRIKMSFNSYSLFKSFFKGENTILFGS